MWDTTRFQVAVAADICCMATQGWRMVHTDKCSVTGRKMSTHTYWCLSASCATCTWHPMTVLVIMTVTGMTNDLGSCMLSLLCADRYLPHIWPHVDPARYVVNYGEGR